MHLYANLGRKSCGIPGKFVAAYEDSCRKLAASFVENFKKYTRMSAEVVAAGPKA